jgi:NAD(P)-dependent dehydrogenase (short-subunit alcohol dehydrogenase family)
MTEPWAQGCVLVTGATGLIGRAIARAFRAAGAKVAVLGTTRERAEAAARATSVDGGALPFACDLRDPDALEACFDAVVATAGPVSVLVNCAGVNFNETLARTGRAEFDQVMALNLRAAFLLSNRACAGMQAAGIAGRVINITSGNYRYVRPGSALYSASKAALESLTRSFALEWGHAGITVNAVAPGLIQPQGDPAPSFRRVAEYYRDNSPLHRITTAEQVADAVLFLASARAAAITGGTIVIDGGFSSGRLDFPRRGGETEQLQEARG